MASSLSEKDAVLRERAAFYAGTCVSLGTDDLARREAAKRYPLPKVSRIRTPKDPHERFSQRWRAALGVLEWMEPNGSSEWHVLSPSGFTTANPITCNVITPKRIAFWAELIANPTELVDEGSESEQEGSR